MLYWCPESQEPVFWGLQNLVVYLMEGFVLVLSSICPEEYFRWSSDQSCRWTWLWWCAICYVRIKAVLRQEALCRLDIHFSSSRRRPPEFCWHQNCNHGRSCNNHLLISLIHDLKLKTHFCGVVRHGCNVHKHLYMNWWRSRISLVFPFFLTFFCWFQQNRLGNARNARLMPWNDNSR